MTFSSIPCRRSVALGVLALSLTRCKAERDPRDIVLRDEGTLCIGSGDLDAATELRAWEPLSFHVRSACLSHQCATARMGTCTVERAGNRLVVKSQLSFRGPEDISQRCASDCAPVEARCSTEPLPAGEYAVVLGARTMHITLPSHLDAGCESREGRATATAVPDAAPPPSLSQPVLTTVPSAPATGVAAEAPPGDTLCIGSAAPGVRALKVGKPLAITVLRKNPCLGSSCTKASARCVAKRRGSEIVLETSFPISTTKPTEPCTEACTALAASCRVEGLRAGDYTIKLGTQQRTFRVPSDTPPPCQP